MNIKEMREEMQRIVTICLENHIGGESYFNELDDMIKNNEDLVSSYVNSIIMFENTPNIIVSGEIGEKLIEYQNNRLIPSFANIITVNGGLRKGKEVERFNFKGINLDCNNKEFIFLDDSYYSGKTLNKIKSAVEENGGKLVVTYVFYDGSKEKQKDVYSLFRYYDDVEQSNGSCKDCYKSHWIDMYGKLIWGCDMSHCVRGEDYERN